ncbi:bifunctional (p)ppGpp synthetase/guanosine-3',5'-bis(diphosphate) 3'-pyrophosphohydrolase [Acinetobacter sp. B5B]|uniref:RelA/SpoT family protein n=1 Tax=Acinetobacter baretiae TaxID=2605383 RepID=UPI0018C24A87|nr:bifunctional (p)ppGpp synthetase/guanosine-3',5'-bis(diphosphate) 3'-pyrophosphohydrolase [Acinetobacter baretiae]MBF7683605.1 bifunctional (p)ppGpp synthetase/guanosine-3',5'-bis(diphosphate) 3'-pyrophosphohydrolase [Acinetobacter baretiae]MBF7686044.1 bifunctional (p)ppGpp synthetase/guanosine-3',5'-bis(diphosphate) 3'-pyrophosphohydrolase [Acinetobacter baretiae]
MVTVREQLPERLTQLTEETAVGHALQQQDLAEWLDRVRLQTGNELKQLKAVAKHTLKKEQQALVPSRNNTFVTGIGVADILAHLRVDEATLAAAVLYRSVREGLTSLDEVADSYGQEVLDLVRGTLAMGRLSELIEQNKRLEDHFNNNQREHLTGIYKMLISVTEDVRVVLIKLAERTFELRELAKSPKDRQERVSREILTIYSPLAHRLGIAQLKWELEDLAFRYLAPDRYKEIAKLLNEKRLEREQYIDDVVNRLKGELKKINIEADISGRVKHIYSIYRKMKSKNLSFGQLYDIRALRVLVHSVSECYHVLGIVHQIWRHIPNQFDDYITNPKANGYRSLHSAVIADHRSLEIQIRTHEMHNEAELGVCSHFNYKEGEKSTDFSFNHRLHSLRAVLENYQERNEANAHAKDEEDYEAIQEFEDFEKIYVFSRDGDIKELPRGSTVLDFAYHVHTEVGNHCYAARVNQRYVPLTYGLKTGEQVEILTKKDREPNRDWLVSSLGYIKTARARDKLRHWFRQQDRSKNLEVGRDLLTKELQRLAIHPKSIDLNEYCNHFNVKTGDDILVALVNGDIGLHALMNQVNRHMNIDQDEPELILKPTLNPRASHTLSAHGILIDGLDNVELNIAQCCQPVHGEIIGGYITLNRGVSIHKKGCQDYIRMITNEPERAVDADWELQPTRGQSIQIVVEAYDRRGLLKDLTQVIFSDNINIRQVNTISENDGIANMKLMIEVKGLAQLSRLLARLEQQPGIISARRLIQGN